MPTSHVFSHQQQHYADQPWAASSNTQQNQLSHAQQVAAAAAAAHQAQQQHYARINNAAAQSQPSARSEQQGPGPHRNSTSENPARADAMDSNMSSLGSPGDANISEENKKVLQWVADLMVRPKREAALMELSKKREQVPELALIIWHSFGKEFRPARLDERMPNEQYEQVS